MNFNSQRLRKINSKLGMNNKLIECKKCRNKFVESELDRIHGHWICRECEDWYNMGVRE